MSQTSNRFTPAQKAEIVRRHVSGKEPISDLADKFGAQPSQIHNWCLASGFKWNFSSGFCERTPGPIDESFRKEKG